MATKIFSMGQMVCEDVQAYVGSCKFMNGTAYAEVDDATFVQLGGLCAEDVYGGKDYNCYEAKLPTAAVEDFSKIAVIDISSVSNGIIAGNTYKIGSKLVDLKMAAGFPARFRKMCKGDKFWLGEGSFSFTTAAPVVGDYVKLETTGKLVDAGETAGEKNKVGLKILAVKPMTIGAQVDGSEQLYLCEVV